MKIGRFLKTEGLEGLKRFVILSARMRWLPQAASGQEAVEGTAGGAALVHVWDCDHSRSLRGFDVSRQ
jgi:hypothetical protein